MSSVKPDPTKFDEDVIEAMKAVKKEFDTYPYIVPNTTNCTRCGSSNTKYKQYPEFYYIKCNECYEYFESHADGGLFYGEEVDEEIII